MLPPESKKEEVESFLAARRLPRLRLRLRCLRLQEVGESSMLTSESFGGGREGRQTELSLLEAGKRLQTTPTKLRRGANTSANQR